MSDYPRRTVILARISDARDGDVHGVDGQVKDARAKANRLDWAVGPEQTHIVVENDCSAFKRQKIELPNGRTELRTVRPGFRRVLDMLASGEADGLIALDLDRTCRDPRDLEDLIDCVESRRPSIPVESVTGSLRLSNDAEVTMARVLVSMANKSSRDTARRVKAQRKTTAEAGSYSGGRRPYGYRADPDAPKHAKTLIIVEDEAAELRRLADALLAGASLRTLVADLRKRKVPTVMGGQWDSATVRDILLKPSVAGLAVYDVRGKAQEYRRRGEPVPCDAGVTGKAKWPAILPEEKWRALASLLTDPARRVSPGNVPKHLGSVIFRCGVCAEAGITETVAINSGSTKYRRDPRYQCRRVGHLMRSAGAVDAYVVDELLRHLSETQAAKLIPRPDVPDKDALRQEANLLRANKANVVSLVADGTFTAEEARIQAKPLNDRLAEIERLLTVSAERSPLDALPVGNAARVPGAGGGSRRKTEVAEAARAMRAAWDALPVGQQRAVLRKAARVTLLKGKPGGGRYADGSYFDGKSTVKIEWL